MKKTHLFIAFLLSLSLYLLSCDRQDQISEIRKDLATLDEAIENVNHYDDIKLHKLDSLHTRLNKTSATSTQTRWDLYMKIGQQYLAFCSDSAVYYYTNACALAQRSAMRDEYIESRIAQAYAQSAAGLFTMAYKSLTSLDTVPLSSEQRILYAKTARQLYSYMDEYAKGHDGIEDLNSQRGYEYEQFLIDSLDKGSKYRDFLYAQQLERNGNTTQAHKIVCELLKSLPENDNLYGMSAYLMAEIHRSMGEDLNYAKYLAIASVSDIKAGVKETMALPALAKWLYNRGEVDKAYHYINTSLQDAMKSNARMRTVEIASLLPLVDDAYRKKVSSSRDELMLYLALVVLLFIIAGVLLAIVFKNMKRASAVNAKLEQQTKVQETYIGHFLGLCSSYSEKLDSMRRMVSRKIASGQTEELLKMLKSAKYTEPANDDFFTIFDETFLDLYPTFVADLNKLLKPDSQISLLKKGAPLTTELRIYAFVRLGVEESVRIAQILHCSVSTIYTYRNRMRGRAINRETFEEDVLHIGRGVSES